MPNGRYSRRSALALAAGLALATPARLLGQPYDGASAMAAAEEISRLEVTEHIPALYTFYSRMHPDAQAIIPRHVVIGWYQADFQPRAPQPAVATGVRFLDWTWGVSGMTYAGTAEVSYTQAFGDGTVEEDVVRLVWHDGEWRWFFGRDRAFVDAQIRRFTQTMNVPQQGNVPYGLDRVVISDGMLDRLPETLAHGPGSPWLAPFDERANTVPSWASRQVGMRYWTGELYPVGYAQVFTLVPGSDAVTAIRSEVERYQQAPPFTLLGWNLTPEQAVPFADFAHFASEAVGNARTILWARAAGDKVAVISHIDDAALQAMATALVG